MVTQFGMSDKIGTIYLGSDQEVFVGMEFGQSREYSEEIAAKIDREVAEILARCYEQAKTILRDKKDKLDALVDALMEFETLNRADFISVMDTGKMPDQVSGDKPRTTSEVLETAKDVLEAEEKQRAEEMARKEAEADKKVIPGGEDNQDGQDLLN